MFFSKRPHHWSGLSLSKERREGREGGGRGGREGREEGGRRERREGGGREEGE